MLPAHSHQARDNHGLSVSNSLTEPLPDTICALLWILLAIYSVGRICQLFASVLPTLLIVLLHVIPPALFVLVHATRLYGFRGFLAFTSCCLITGTIFESLSLRTGFPFGRYVFTSVMGPEVLGLPFLLVLAYLGVGYSSWIIACLIFQTSSESPRSARLFLRPALAAIVMTCWDVAMDPDWATLDRAWIWRNGGPWFGVPVSNYAGWLITTFTFYLLFSLRYADRSIPSAAHSRSFWRVGVALYAVCALGNLLIPFQPVAPAIVADPGGRLWQTSTILLACVLCSFFLMFPFAVVAWHRIPPTRTARSDPHAGKTVLTG
jgi:putative membrane protein